MEESTICYKLSKDVVLRKTENPQHFFLLNNVDGAHYTLNLTGYWILEQIEKGNCTKKNLFKDFISTFNVDRYQGEIDFEEVFNIFISEKIIKEGKNEEL